MVGVVLGIGQASVSHLGSMRRGCEKNSGNSLAITFTCCFSAATSLGMVQDVSCMTGAQGSFIMMKQQCCRFSEKKRILP